MLQKFIPHRLYSYRSALLTLSSGYPCSKLGLDTLTFLGHYHLVRECGRPCKLLTDEYLYRVTNFEDHLLKSLRPSVRPSICAQQLENA